MDTNHNNSSSLSPSSINNKNSSATIFSKENKKKSGGKKVVNLSTEPQSVAARERRHRISNRFKILQSLVPGGSKMDTVSLLDEAIHYVKFLKGQIWLHQSIINSAADDHKNFNFLLHDYYNPNYTCFFGDGFGGKCSSKANYGVSPGNYYTLPNCGGFSEVCSVGLQTDDEIMAVDDGDAFMY